MMADLSLSTFQSLENLLSPLYYTNEESLPSISPGTPKVQTNLMVQAFLSEDCTWGCIYNGPVIRCFPVKINPNTDLSAGRGRIPVVISTVSYHFPGSIVKCATELSIHSHRSSGTNKLLLGLDCINEGGALVIYDPIRGQPMKWISLPAGVTSVAVMSHFENENQPFFNESLMAMVGIAAVGLYGGKLLMVDLGLDHLEMSSETKRNIHTSHSLDKRWDITYVHPHERSIVRERRTATASKRLICLDIGNQDFDDVGGKYDPELFYYSDKAGNIIGTYNKEEVYVSCLQYVPSIGSLIVGFNFGGLQIWRVDDYQLEFGSEVSIQNLEVHSVEFQQPIDDPKNFCYLWVLYGTKTAELQHSRAVLYAMFFRDRISSENSSVLYENLESCVGRLTINLQDFYSTEDEEIDDVSLSSPRHFVRPLRMWNQGENLTCFSWESNRDGVYYIGIFDLNQWYSSQTPCKLDCFGEIRLNPYWSSISFRNPIDVRRNIYSQMWDVRVIPRTMERWENQFSKQDVHFYPASLTFQAVCLASSGTYVFENFCIQEKLFRLIQKDGYQMMTEPGVLRKLCNLFGLSPLCPPISNSKMSDQFYIFTALLENHRPALIIHMANRWVDGSMANLGCNIELILRWVSYLTVAIRVLADEHWINMTRFRRDFLPPDTSHFFNYSNFLWNQLNGILDTLVRHDRVHEDEERVDEITKLQFSLRKLISYSSALLVMHKARILPVMEDFDVIIPLKVMCDQRRAVVSHALENYPYLEPELRQGHTLLIDFLLENFEEDFLREEWDVKPGEHIYPPKHPAFIFNMLLGNWIDIDPKIIARVIFYFVLDVMNLVGQQTTLRGDFMSLIQLTPTEQQEVVQLWRVDHGEFHEPLAFLSQRLKFDEEEGLPWSAAIVHLVAQGSSANGIDILSRCCPPKLGKLLVNLVFGTQTTPEDKLVQIVSSNCFPREQGLLFHCFEKASDHGLLEKFIDVHSRHTPILVQQALILYLDRPPLSFSNQVLLLIFFIRRKDNVSAIEQYEKMKNLWLDKRNISPENRKIWETKEMEINGILTQSSKKRVMGFLGYSSQKSIPKPPPLDVKTNKYISKTASSKIGLPAKTLPAFQRLLESESHLRKGATPISPLRRYSGRINKSSHNVPTVVELPLINEEPTSPDRCDSDVSILMNAENLEKINLELVLKSPRVDYRRFEDDEVSEFNQSIYMTPSGTTAPVKAALNLHSIMKKTEVPLRKRVLLKTRFEVSSDPEESPEHKILEAEVVTESTPSLPEPFQTFDVDNSRLNTPIGSTIEEELPGILNKNAHKTLETLEQKSQSEIEKSSPSVESALEIDESQRIYDKQTYVLDGDVDASIGFTLNEGFEGEPSNEEEVNTEVNDGTEINIGSMVGITEAMDSNIGKSLQLIPVSAEGFAEETISHILTEIDKLESLTEISIRTSKSLDNSSLICCSKGNQIEEDDNMMVTRSGRRRSISRSTTPERKNTRKRPKTPERSKTPEPEIRSEKKRRTSWQSEISEPNRMSERIKTPERSKTPEKQQRRNTSGRSKTPEKLGEHGVDIPIVRRKTQGRSSSKNRTLEIIPDQTIIEVQEPPPLDVTTNKFISENISSKIELPASTLPAFQTVLESEAQFIFISPRVDSGKFDDDEASEINQSIYMTPSGTTGEIEAGLSLPSTMTKPEVSLRKRVLLTTRFEVTSDPEGYPAEHEIFKVEDDAESTPYTTEPFQTLDVDDLGLDTTIGSTTEEESPGILNKNVHETPDTLGQKSRSETVKFSPSVKSTLEFDESELIYDEQTYMLDEEVDTSLAFTLNEGFEMEPSNEEDVNSKENEGTEINIGNIVGFTETMDSNVGKSLQPILVSVESSAKETISDILTEIDKMESLTEIDKMESLTEISINASKSMFYSTANNIEEDDDNIMVTRSGRKKSPSRSITPERTNTRKRPKTPERFNTPDPEIPSEKKRKTSKQNEISEPIRISERRKTPERSKTPERRQRRNTLDVSKTPEELEKQDVDKTIVEKNTQAQGSSKDRALEIISDKTIIENNKTEIFDSSHSGEKKLTKKIKVLKRCKSEELVDFFPRRLTRNQKALLENSQVDLSSLGDPNLKTPPASPGPESKNRKKSGTLSTSSSEHDSVSVPPSQNQVVRKKVVRVNRRSHTPESDAASQHSEDITSMTIDRRMTRSQSRARSEMSGDDGSFLETSMNRSESEVLFSDNSLDSNGTEKKRKPRRKMKTTSPAINTITEIIEIQDEAKAKAGPSSKPVSNRGRRKAISEPIYLHKIDSDFDVPEDIVDTSFMEDNHPRREIFGYIPGLSTVIEDSESSLTQTPKTTPK